MKPTYQDHLGERALAAEADGDAAYAQLLRDEAKLPHACPGCGVPKSTFLLLDVREDDAYPHDWVCSACDRERLREIEGAEADAARQARLTSMDYLRQRALARLSVVRARVEAHGFAFGGRKVELNESTQARMGNAVQGMTRKAARAGSAVVSWQVVPGQFVQMDLATVGAMADAAFDHVQLCFDRAKAFTNQILAAQTAEELEAINLTEGWPGAALDFYG